MSIAPNTGRPCAVPRGSAVWNGGTNAGGNNGLINGCPAGLCGLPSPASTRGLVDVGCTSNVAMFTKPGFAPVNVPVHAVGTRAEPVVTQLLLPVLTRPET